MKPCREWEKSKQSAGYGQRNIRGKVVLVHRWAWEQEHGPIPEGLVIRHLCHNRACYEITHLAIGTQQDNMDDNHRDGRPCGGTKAKVSHEEIIAAYESGHSSKEVAGMFGYHPMSITEIVRKHRPDLTAARVGGRGRWQTYVGVAP